MTGSRTKPKASDAARAGARALSLLARPLNVAILQQLEAGPMPLVELRRAAGAPPQTTVRAHLKELAAAGVITRHRHGGFPGGLDLELSDVGRQLMAVAGILQSWLSAAPEGPLTLGGIGAKNAIKALVEGWATNLVRALAARPLSLTELDGLISSLSYPSLERRLTSMRLAGLLEARPSNGHGRPYGVTAWLRQAIAPLGAAANWERANAPDAAPMGRLDVEAAFLLAVPLLDLAAGLTGACRLAVEMRNGTAAARFAGVVVTLERGSVVSCVSRLQGPADAWAAGAPPVWLLAIAERAPGRLQLGGDRPLAQALVEGFHSALLDVSERH